MEVLLALPHEIWQIMVDLSPSLFLGLMLAGALHVFLPPGLIRRGLSGRGFGPVLWAALIGVPMPLCSCGVVPTAIGLRQQGASRAAATSFLISTPQTGVDSILVSASFLGWPFALFKVAAALVTGLFGGWLVSLSERDEAAAVAPPLLPLTGLSAGGRWLEVLRYSVFELLAMIDVWIVTGVLASALLSVLVPAGSLIGLDWLQGLGGMVAVLLLALPLYVCTTGSVPIAAALIAAGMPLGSALVFLMAGPATNLATMGAVGRAFGGRMLAIYLGVVAACSIGFGLVFEWVLATPARVDPGAAHALAGWPEHLLAALMSGLLLALMVRRLLRARQVRRRADRQAA